MNSIFLNFYAFGSILAAFFCLYVAFFFLTIKDGSKAAFHLGLCCLSSFFHHIGYIWGFISYDESTIFHRWIVVAGPLISFTQLVAFFIYFPALRSRGLKIGLSFYALLHLGVLAVTAWYVTISLGATRTFVAGSHYWDFETHVFYKYFSIIILFYDVSYLVIAIWKAVVEKGKERRSVIYILLAYIVVTVVPGILNAMSRDGSVSRAAYQQSFDAGMVIGMFLILIVYVNATKERTTILSRIVGISLATFAVCYLLVGYSILEGYEETYDESKNKDTVLAVMNNQSPQGLAYVSSFDPDSGKFEIEKGSKDPRFNSEDNLETKFFRIRNQLINVGSDSSLERSIRIDSILKSSPREFYAYAEGLRAFLKSRQEASDADIATYFRGTNEKLNIIRSKFSHLADRKDSQSIRKLFSSETIGVSETLSIVRDKALAAIKEGKSEAEISKIVLSFLSPIHEEGKRVYRGTRLFKPGDPKPQFYLAYYFSNPRNGKIYEVGYDYRDYRAFQNKPAMVLVISLVGMVLVVVVGFQFFFRNALVLPMDEIVTGLREVNSGNLNYRLVPRVEDEIGFMARSFNRMARSIQAGRKRLEQYADELEEKVKERTSELEQTLGEVRELKQQQDGDYFLTSLLIKPLGSNKAVSENVRVDFFVEQKKKFTFRRFEDEIGGDLNISNHIRLRDRSYTIFLNADAMGKSMQGAGGALVLGAVCESIIERTRMAATMREQSPERWLKNAFTELHKVFESFDGSMLVSTVLGLIDDESGILYYINAEHPWTVLYRDGIASFIEDDLMFRKLGTTGLDGQIYVKTFQLEPGDVIIAGSDGRDDILIGTEKDGSRIINDDELLFLRKVEQGKGDLKSIYLEITSHGVLTDDLSMIRLSFKEDDQNVKDNEKAQREKVLEFLRQAKERANNKDIKEALSFLEEAEMIDSRIPEVKKNFVRLFIKMKNYPKAVLYAEDYLNIKPVDKEILYVASFAARKAGDLGKAQDFGERLYLREPEHLKNLINLAQTYIALKNYERAVKMTIAAQILDSENEIILRIRDVLNGLSGKHKVEDREN
ncbi:SpoIIE-like protein phosphatase domain protein [Leptospira broomii serovar Hurstbridge str. 5399]|uniref:SpoIIE-like protein phosphatase domain protein n=1 Tax=Leptospira broomii serovar Hurstbridge str. 5399 TaxID=1049789 RepID=T0F2I3_9LEPT|nr:SpoIIE family protein phosphatase [Leptospira broomii]EQA45340.1 SpoIIE-like protein phosphatase domain protein [Leptospira broomii serovar Hurstbridge str. 5399]